MLAGSSSGSFNGRHTGLSQLVVSRSNHKPVFRQVQDERGYVLPGDKFRTSGVDTRPAGPSGFAAYAGSRVWRDLLLAMMPAQSYSIGTICTCRQVSDWSW